MKYLVIVFLTMLFSPRGCERIDFQLPLAETYQILGEHDISLNTRNRKANMYFISSEADSFESFAQTSMFAAFELSKINKDLDLIQVMLVPDKAFIATSVYYAQVFYAPDKKGALGLSGVDLSSVTFSEWFVRVAENPLNDKELTIAKLWVTHQKDFPSTDMPNSLSYDRQALRMFIADSLRIDITEVKLPIPILLIYDELGFIEY